MYKLLLLMAACFVVGAAVADDAKILANCPPQGDAKQAAARALNPLKRRMSVPIPREIDPKVTLQAMLAPGDDTNRWDTNRGGVIEGYVADVKVGGIESVNCHTRDPLYRDTHIEITAESLKRDEGTYVIVEVTPQVRHKMAIQGVDWSTGTLRKTLLGKRVRITGWLLFDVEHKPNATNTASPNAHIWRATVWELHPVTAIEVLP